MGSVAVLRRVCSSIPYLLRFADVPSVNGDTRMQIWHSPWIPDLNGTPINSGMHVNRTLTSSTFNRSVVARASPILRAFDLVRPMANQGREVPFVVPANANKWWNADTVAIVTGGAVCYVCKFVGCMQMRKARHARCGWCSEQRHWI